MVIIYTTAHVQSLSSFGPNLVAIFEVIERWVVVDVWVMLTCILTPSGNYPADSSECQI